MSNLQWGGESLPPPMPPDKSNRIGFRCSNEFYRLFRLLSRGLTQTELLETLIISETRRKMETFSPSHFDPVLYPFPPENLCVIRASQLYKPVEAADNKPYIIAGENQEFYGLVGCLPIKPGEIFNDQTEDYYLVLVVMPAGFYIAHNRIYR